MKTGIYNALAALNRGFDVTLESLMVLQTEGVLTDEYVQQRREITEELRSDINSMILNKLSTREGEDRDHFAAMRRATEVR